MDGIAAGGNGVFHGVARKALGTHTWEDEVQW